MLRVVEINRSFDYPYDVALFSESKGRYVVTTTEADADRLAELFEGLACRRVGRVTERAQLVVRRGSRAVLETGRAELPRAFKETFSDD